MLNQQNVAKYIKSVFNSSLGWRYSVCAPALPFTLLKNKLGPAPRHLLSMDTSSAHKTETLYEERMRKESTFTNEF